MVRGFAARAEARSIGVARKNEMSNRQDRNETPFTTSYRGLDGGLSTRGWGTRSRSDQVDATLRTVAISRCVQHFCRPSRVSELPTIASARCPARRRARRRRSPSASCVSAQSFETSSVNLTRPSARSSSSLRVVPDAAAHERREPRVELHHDALRFAPEHAERRTEQILRQLARLLERVAR